MFLLLKKYIFKNPKNSTTLAFFVVIFFVEANTKREREIPCQKPLRPISNAWENSKLPPFLENIKNLNLPPYIKERMVSIMLQLFSIMPLRNCACM